jgi:Zn-dependent peptidase ImmA (M78 family)
METFNQTVLEAILASRHLTLKGVSERMGVSEGELREAIDSNPLPNQRLLQELSAQLSVPTFVFYMSRPPELGQAIVDFRQTRPSVAPKLAPTVESIALAQRLHEVANEFGHRDSLPRNVDLREIKSEEFALSLRQRLEISLDTQVSAGTPAKFYSICRAAVERTGVFVLHESFPSEDGSGFCLAEGAARFIVINTHRQNPGRRNFTLFHELAHVLIGQSGISDPFTTNNAIERACNLFAAQLLVPRRLAEMAFARSRMNQKPSADDVRRCASFLNISQQATVVRLEQLALVADGSHQRWLETVKSYGNPDFERSGGGGGNIAQEKVKLAKYGFTFARVFGRAVEDHRLSPLDLYRMSGLKPKYQRAYFEFASVAGAEDADD